VVDVARVWLDKDRLKFAWNELEQAERTRANCLRNCALKVSAGEATHAIALSKPQAVEPLGVDLDRGAKVTLKLDSAPEPHTLRLQVVGLEGPAPAPGFQPTNKTVEARYRGAADKGNLSILLSENNSSKLDLRLTFDATKPRTATIDLTPYYQVPGGSSTQPQWLATAQFASVAAGIVRMSEAKTDGLKDPQRQIVAQQIQAAKKALEQLNPLDAMCQKINKNVRVHYRVFVMADDREVELFTTKPADAPKGK
jgi:hypothetical protein